ncbi:MAG TPA: MarR family winged helix-turn-helix transcriptional regulator, partial [Gaiellales bacterium]
MSGLTVLNQAPHRSAALLVQLARRMRVRSEAAIAPLGLRARHLIALTVLRDQDGSTQAALATTLHVDRTNLVGLLNELEEQGLIARRRSSEDRRRHIVELTDAGAHLLAQAEFALAAAEDEVLAALDREQREQLYALLQLATAESAAACAGA